MPWFRRRQPPADLAPSPEPPAAPATIICANCGTANPAGARFCNHCGVALSSAAETEVTIPTRTPTGPLITDGSGAERRIVTVLFADLANSTALAEQMDAEEWRALLADYFQAMAEEIQRHGGIVEKFIGDAVMGIFGLPRAHEDDPVRAVRAGLDMQIALGGLNAARLAASADPRRDAVPSLAMRIGINTGNVVAAMDDERRDFLVTGDPVNVAARLQQLAVPGTVVIGPRTFRDTQSTITVRALPAAELKGKARPVRAWEVLSMRDANPVPLLRARSLDAPRTAFIGRDVEMRLLLGVYDRVCRDRRPHVVTILGTPGVGKTRLAREFLNQIAETLPEPEIIVGRVALYGTSITYWPLAEMIRDFSDIGPAMPPDEARAQLLRAVRQALGEAGRGEDPVQIARALGTTIGLEQVDRDGQLTDSGLRSPAEAIWPWRVFFESIAATGPLVLMVDDIHWADDALLTLLEGVIAPATNLPLLLLCTARPDLLQRHPDWGTGVGDQLNLALDPLSNDQSGQLLTDLLGGDALPADLRADILGRGEGNPFFIEEIVRMLIDRGLLGQVEGHWQRIGTWQAGEDGAEPDIPDTVQGVLAARLDLLTLPEREVLRHAAIIGRSFWPAALLGMAPDMTRVELEMVLDDLVAKDLIAPATTTALIDLPATPDEPRYLFKHVLTRDVVKETMSHARQAQEHQRFALWLEHFAADRTDEFAELLARHYEAYYRQSGLARSRDVAARRVVLDKVIEYLEQAGNGAIARQAPQAAIRYFTRALTLLDEDGEDPRPDRRHMRIVLLARRGDARALLADGDGGWHDYREALRWWQAQAPASSPDVVAAAADREERTIGMRLYRRLVMLPTRYPAWFRQEPPIEELQGYLVAGLQLADEAGEHETLDRVALLSAKTFFWWSWPQGRGQAQLLDALASAEEAVRIAELLDAPREASIALDALGNMEATVTDLRGHLASQARRLHWARRIDDRTEIVDIHAEVSAAHQMVGEYARAVEHALTALAQADRLENDILRSQALQRLVIAEFEWEHFTAAITHGEQLQVTAARTPITRQNHYRWATLALALALWRTDQFERAEDVLDHLAELEPIAESQYVAVFRGRVQLARTNWADAERTLRAALEIRAGRHSQPMLLAELAELGARLDNPDLLKEFGLRAVDLGERSGARKPLAQALRARGAVALRAGRLHEARRDIQAALGQYEALGTLWEVGRTRYILAEIARQSPGSTHEQMRQELRRAAELFSQVGAQRDAQRALADLASGVIRLV